MAEVVIYLFGRISEGELDFADQEGVFELKVDENVSRGFVEFVFDSDDFEVFGIGGYFIIDSVNLRFGSNTLASEQIHYAKGHQLDVGLHLLRLVKCADLSQLL